LPLKREPRQAGKGTGFSGISLRRGKTYFSSL
jgi:hypothetical protein